MQSHPLMRWPRPKPEARPGLHYRPRGGRPQPKTSLLIAITTRMSARRDQAREANRMGVGMKAAAAFFGPRTRGES
jgi:hypothetical protein